jgi:hypothetical protein
MNLYSNKKEESSKNSLHKHDPAVKHSESSTHDVIDNRQKAFSNISLQGVADNSPVVNQTSQLQVTADGFINQDLTLQRKENTTGIPDNLKSGMENLSGYSMDEVKVHRNSNEPAKLNAHAYAQGSNIHIASGQDKHLPHELAHVVQQKQGRVKPTKKVNGNVNVNDDAGLEKEADIIGQKALQMKSFESENLQLSIDSNRENNSPIQMEPNVEETSVDDSMSNEVETAPPLPERPVVEEEIAPPLPDRPGTEAGKEKPVDPVLSGPGFLTIRERKAQLALRGLRDGQKILDDAGLGLEPKKSEGESSVLNRPDVATIIDNADEQGNILTEKKEIVAKGGMDSEQAASVAEHGSKITERTVNEGLKLSAIHTLYSDDGIANAIDTEKNIFDLEHNTSSLVSNMFGPFAQKVVTFGAMFIAPVISAVLAGLDLKSKMSQRTAFKETLKTASANDNEIDKEPKWSEMLNYAIGKVWKGIANAAWLVAKNVVIFVNNLLLVIPSPAAAVAGVIKVAEKVMNAMSAAGSWIKRGYQLFKGQQKVKKAKYVYDRAVSGDQKALKLILDLELSSVAGTDFSKVDSFLKGLGKYTDPINMRKGDRIVDLIGTGGPKSTEALHEVLMLVKDNASSRKIILNDLEASMTGFGT